MEVAAEKFFPEEIALLRSVLDKAAAQLPPHKRTCIMKSFLAEGILKRAATGERDPMRLRVVALLAAAYCSSDAQPFGRSAGIFRA
jgi:hypothetical protein